MFGGPDEADENILQNCFFLQLQMFSLSIETQRKRPPFSKFCFADGWAGSRRAEGPALSNGNIFYDCSLLLFQMLSNNIEKQRKRQPFFKFGLGKEMLTILEICLADVKRKYVLGLFIFTV